MSEVELLKKHLAIANEALQAIVDNSSDGCSETHKDYKYSYTSEYGHGSGEGHACASRVAQKALDRQRGETPTVDRG